MIGFTITQSDQPSTHCFAHEKLPRQNTAQRKQHRLCRFLKCDVTPRTQANRPRRIDDRVLLRNNEDPMPRKVKSNVFENLKAAVFSRRNIENGHVWLLRCEMIE